MPDPRLKSLADLAGFPIGFEGDQDSIADVEQLAPIFEKLGIGVGRSSSAFGNSARCTLAGRPDAAGRYCQTSSAVKVRIGATRRTSASAILQRTVCAERRSMPFGAKV